MQKRKRPQAIKAILFDFGKVLADFNFAPAFKKLSKNTLLSAAEIEDFFRRSGLEVLYDGGKITSSQFYRAVKKGLGHSLSYDEFRGIWNNIFKEDRKMTTLVGRLKKKRYRLVLISNTNAMHFEHLRGRYAFLDHFDRLILSFKEKTRKPDERIYRKAARACKARPDEIFYIDDREDLTEAAKDLGFHAFTFKKNHTELFEKMKKLEIHHA
jgi:putative hydrolase of the HAD superfamily